MRQHAAADVAQVGGALGEQGILQRLLLPGGRFDHTHPGRFGAFALLEASIDFVGKLGVVEHFLVGDEDLANRLGLAAFDQALDIATNITQRSLQALALDTAGLTAQWIVEDLLHLDMRRADGDTGRGGNCLDLATGQRRADDWLDVDGGGLGADGRQRLDVFAQAFFNRGQQGWQRIASDRRLSDEFQHLATPRAEAQQLAQAFNRHRTDRAIDNAHANIAVETFRQLREDLRRACMQAVGVGQGDAGTGPVGRQFATQHFKHGTAAGGAAQFLAAPFDQQGTQALEQRLMRFAQAGQAEQAIERLAQIAHGFVRRDERQTRAFDRLLAVQPPQAIAQGQCIDLLQHGGKPVAHAIGLA
ncbi:hypothetical protein [Pseudomonas sp. 37 R 15]|nr:hypothetical protein [Pseudomonas sp. 37 R 15]